MKKISKVIVSGATGFVGQHLIPLLLNNNFQVIATSRDQQKASKFSWYKDVQFITLDLSKDQMKIDEPQDVGLIHLAWQGLPNYKSAFHIDVNLPQSYNFIKSLVLQNLSQVLVTGTCYEYGLQSGPIASITKPLPSNPYAIAKNNLREQLYALSKEYSFCFQWARLFYMYGKGQNQNSVLSQLDNAINKNENTFNMSGGNQIRDYLPVEKVVQQIFDLFVSSQEGIFNVCSGNPITIKNLVDNHIRQRSAKIKLNLNYYPYPDNEPMEFWGIRDIGETLFLPAIPNAPLQSKNQNQLLAPMRLRLNSNLNFLENEAFDSKLIDYTEGYENSQAYSMKFKKHMLDVLLLLKSNLSKNSLIVEVGCGKGDFVEMIESDGYFKVKGYDASYEGRNRSIEKRYLNSSDKIEADLVVLRHVLEHVPKPYEFLSMLKSIFGKAKIYIEVPNYDWILENKTFFDITYEHVNYFSKQSLRLLFEKDVTKSGLLFNDQYQYLISELSSLDLKFDCYYKSDNWKFITFDELFPNIQNDMKRFEKIAKNHSVYLWGAATKGCLFLAHCANNNLLINNIRFVVDQNPKKIGIYLPGSLIVIKS